MKRRVSNIILLETTDQYNELLKGNSVTLRDGTVLTEFDKNAVYKVPSSQVYRYRVKIKWGRGIYINLDVPSKNDNLFADSSVASNMPTNFKTLYQLYANQPIPVTFEQDSNAGSVMMNITGSDSFTLTGAISDASGTCIGVVFTVIPSTDVLEINITKHIQ